MAASDRPAEASDRPAAATAHAAGHPTHHEEAHPIRLAALLPILRALLADPHRPNGLLAAHPIAGLEGRPNHYAPAVHPTGLAVHRKEAEDHPTALEARPIEAARPNRHVQARPTRHVQARPTHHVQAHPIPRIASRRPVARASRWRADITTTTTLKLWPS